MITFLSSEKESTSNEKVDADAFRAEFHSPIVDFGKIKLWIASFLAMTHRTSLVRHCEERSNPENVADMSR
jgi:hypothetical protein